MHFCCFFTFAITWTQKENFRIIIIIALKLQNSELKKSLETARQEKDKSQDHFGKQMQKLSVELSKKCSHAQQVILNLLQTDDENDA